LKTKFRLFDGEHVTCDDYHMWLCPFSGKEKVRVMINLSVSKKLHGLRIWNYNKSSDDTYRGVGRFVYFEENHLFQCRLKDFMYN
jgi:hypothetical protein